MSLTSTAFKEGGAIPAAHSCDAPGGTGKSIPLTWSGAPTGTQSFAVVMRDLSLAGSGNYHWVIWDIPAATTSLDEGIPNEAAPATPAGAKQTHWSFGEQFGYGHMCPPNGTHDYELVVYAFTAATLPPAADPTSPNDVDAVIQANKTASASLTGKYTKQ
jgi:Raf kinase inhibitor-like YbhB/YbcL family protein